MRIAIYGAGAVGGYFGGRLAQGGHEVSFIARGATLQALQTQGLQVESIAGDFVVHPVHATADPATVGVVDLVIVAVKAWQVPAVAVTLAPLLGDNTLILPLQNGVEAPAQLAAVVGREHVLGGTCVIVAEVVAPGHIRHGGAQPTVNIGELDNRRTERIEAVHYVFAQCQGVSANVVNDITVALWQKFMIIAPWSGVGAVTRMPIYDVCRQPAPHALLQGAIAEIEAVARAHGVALPATASTDTLARLEGLGPGLLASMQRDLINGRPSELEAQTGAVVRLGQEMNVATPVNRFIYASLVLLEQQARGALPE